MMKRTVFIAAVIMLLFGHWARAAVSVIMNGSFENDAWPEDQYITEYPPYKWPEVDLRVRKFGGLVSTDWSTHGHYSLTLFSQGLGGVDANDMATLSQEVYLRDVGHIIFNLRLSTNWDIRWDPNRFSAVLLIDQDVVWDSNDWDPDENDEYREQVAAIDEKYKDKNLHRLSLGIRANAPEPTATFVCHIAQWDFVRFDTHCDCGGFDYPPGDFNRDCLVDWLDFGMVFDQWLTAKPEKKFDLFSDDDNIFNLRDFAVFADTWNSGESGQEKDLLFADFNNDGIVNMKDFAISAEARRSEDVDYSDILTIAEEWLETNWLYGLE